MWLRYMSKYNKCRQSLERIRDQKKDKRWRFKQWFKSKGGDYESEFGDWYGYFSREDRKCRDWDSLVYHYSNEKGVLQSTS